jgi:hypothetical protein
MRACSSVDLFDVDASVLDGRTVLALSTSSRAAASPTALIPFLAFECLALRPADFVDRNDRQNCKGRESNCHLGAPAQPSRPLYSRGECFPRLNTNHRSRSLSSDWPKQRAGRFLSPAVLASRSWHLLCNSLRMPLYYFKLVDSRIVSDHGVHKLADEAAARKAAIELARSIRETRPDLVGQGCSVSVTDEYGAGICLVPVDGS